IRMQNVTGDQNYALTISRLDDVPLDLFPRITAMREHRPRGGGPVTGLDVEIGIDDRDRREIARSRGSFSWGPRADFAQLREGMRDALGLGGTPVAAPRPRPVGPDRSEEHTSELQSRFDIVCRLLLEQRK